SHAGSFFLAEIRRTTSSLRPRGMASASMSVTKPHLYSWLANVSMVLVESLTLYAPEVLGYFYIRSICTLLSRLHIYMDAAAGRTGARRVRIAPTGGGEAG